VPSGERGVGTVSMRITRFWLHVEGSGEKGLAIMTGARGFEFDDVVVVLVDMVELIVTAPVLVEKVLDCEWDIKRDRVGEEIVPLFEGVDGPLEELAE